MRSAVGIFLICIAAVGVTPAFGEAAIAFAQGANGSWAAGTSDNLATRAAAHRAAVDQCEMRGTDCKVVRRFNNTCVSLAVQERGNGYSLGSGPVPKDADRVAFDSCAKMGNTCKIVAAVCDQVAEPVLLCVRPIFSEKWRLESTAIDYMDDTEQSVDAMKSAIYLEAKYCVRSKTYPMADRADKLNEKCWQYTGRMRGDTVYWSNCSDFGDSTL